MMEYAVKITRQNGDERGKDISYIPKGSWWRGGIDNCKRWKTKKGAKAAAEALIEKEKRYYDMRKENAKRYRGYARDPGEYVPPEYEIVQVKPLPPPKFSKKKLTQNDMESIQNKIIDLLLKKGWKANRAYNRDLNDRGFSTRFRSSHAYLIDPQDRFALTLKSTVLTLHDGSRQFCKVVSMGYNEIEITKTKLRCGIVAIEI